MPGVGRGVSLYDVLGVERDATPDEIKAAWRDATDKFEPGQGSAQFRLFNDAADVLLDPDKRSAYDAELDDAAAAADEPATPAAAPAEDRTTTLPATHTDTSKRKARDQDTRTQPKKAEPKKAEAKKGEPKKAEAKAPRTGGAPIWLVAALSFLTVLVFAAGVIVFLVDRGDEQDTSAGDDAVASAERALPAVLSYDYRQLETDRNQAVKFLSKSYASEYTKTFDQLIESSGSQPGPAVQAKAVVKATVEDAGVVSATDRRARVIVFLNQNTQKGDAAPTQSLNRLVVSMVRSDNRWLVDNITSY